MIKFQKLLDQIERDDIISWDKHGVLLLDGQYLDDKTNIFEVVHTAVRKKRGISTEKQNKIFELLKKANLERHIKNPDYIRKQDQESGDFWFYLGPEVLK